MPKLDKQFYIDTRTAIREGDVDRLTALMVADKSRLTMMTAMGTWLHVAASYGQLEIVKRLIELGADVNIAGDVDIYGTPGATPINRAASDGHIETVKFFLERGARMDVSEPQLNPLFSAIYNGHTAIAKLLIDNGIDTEVIYRGINGRLNNALKFAVDYGCAEIIDLLKAQGCRLPVEGVDVAVNEPTQRLGDPKFHAAQREIIAKMAQVYGPVEPRWLEEVIGFLDVYITIHIIPPTPQHPYYTLFTVGMSNQAMVVPPGQEAFQYAELMMRLPLDWPLPRYLSEEGDEFWPVDWLTKMAYYSHNNENEWLGGAHTIVSSDEPPVPLGPGTEQTCLLLVADFHNGSPLKLSDGRTIRIYSVIPIYTEERDFEVQHGIIPLLQRFKERQVPTVVNATRPNACAK